MWPFLSSSGEAIEARFFTEIGGAVRTARIAKLKIACCVGGGRKFSWGFSC
jgi:hypothetical protein